MPAGDAMSPSVIEPGRSSAQFRYSPRGASLEEPPSRRGTATASTTVKLRGMDFLRRLGAYLLRAIVDLGHDISPVPLPRREDLDDAP
ncbi:hypothetical protein GCM10009827_093590 [Dactylosporangium maewongense]|uniref:Uncharacterized protein n=1 Tax=Dactylosporangium maewongense TaxID=634393 RepID=A0ABN2CFE8_9ACTN